MVQRVSTVAFEGIEARAVDVQVGVAPGLPAFITSSACPTRRCPKRASGCAALVASGLALPARRIIVNLAPADLPKALAGFTVLGELGLDGSIAPVAGVLPAAKA